MIKWIHKEYHDLSKDELYDLLKLRQEVFIVEQNCNYLDADNYDLNSIHLMAYKEFELVAYMRIVPAGTLYSNISFGRILVRKDLRRLGIGKELLTKGISLFDHNETLVMSAQVYLVKFYEFFGFITVGEEFLEDEIPHIKMIRNGENLS